jgi:hypothetical protein
MRTVLIFSLTCFMLAFAQSNEARVIRDVGMEGMAVDKSMVIPRTEWRQTSLIERAKSFAQDECRVGLGRLTVGVSRDEVVLSLGISAIDANGYALAHRLFQEGHNTYSLLAQVVCSRRGLILMTNEFGKISRDLLSGRDPTVFGKDPETYRLLHFVARKAQARNIKGSKDLSKDSILEAYLRAEKQLSVSSCRHAVLDLANQTGVPELFVTCRSDTWFLDDTDFPSFYPFTHTEPLPSLENYQRHKQVSCHYVTSMATSCKEKSP